MQLAREAEGISEATFFVRGRQLEPIPQDIFCEMLLSFQVAWVRVETFYLSPDSQVSCLSWTWDNQVEHLWMLCEGEMCVGVWVSYFLGSKTSTSWLDMHCPFSLC